MSRRDENTKTQAVDQSKVKIQFAINKQQEFRSQYITKCKPAPEVIYTL